MPRLRAAGCTIETLNDIEAHAALIDLHLQVHENNAHRFVTLKRAFIPALAHQLGSGFICTVIRRGAELLGSSRCSSMATPRWPASGHNMEATTAAYRCICDCCKRRSKPASRAVANA